MNHLRDLSSVLDPFQVQITPNNSLVLEGGGTSFKCSVLPGAVYTWVHNGRNIDLNEAKEKYVVQQNGLLVINGVQKEDAGTYVCLAENKAGISAASATLSIGCKSVIIDLLLGIYKFHLKIVFNVYM